MTHPQKTARWTSLFLLGVFVVTYGSCAELTSLRCSRASGECLFTQKRLLWTRQSAFKVTDLLGASMAGGSLGGSRQPRQNVLYTRRGPVHFEVWGRSSIAPISTKVDGFLKDRAEPRLDIVHDTRLSVLVAASFLLAASLLLFGLSFNRSLTNSRRV